MIKTGFKGLGRVLWAVIEYIWYPVFLTTGIWMLMQSGFFDGEYGMARVGALIVSMALWKLAKMLARVEWRTRIQLLMSFCWMVGYISYVLSYHSDWMDLHPSRQVWIAMVPLMFFVKMVINREAVAPEWILRWINRRKAQRASAGVSGD